MSTHPGATLPKAYADITPESDEQVCGVMDPAAPRPSPEEQGAYFTMCAEAFYKAHGPVGHFLEKKFDGGEMSDDGLIVFNGQGWLRVEIEMFDGRTPDRVREVVAAHRDAFIMHMSFDDGTGRPLFVTDVLVGNGQGWGRAILILVPTEGALHELGTWFKQ
jgi:hypothetical protein